ncbi:phosphoesterase [Periweissella cryptocerci]|uniref:Phosphoesterase n=1 Tax=Periweissella cryptocerci TaxID=2506420 RepID=A0A4V1AIK8_9LACO|nr:metallophosphoesterase [Periweissella cryptocerci]QBO35855.1 phosphoesterase [Periweissella cryptocerci]
MTKIAVVSDLHMDLNHVDVVDFLARSADWLVAQGVQYYVIAGDLFNDFAKTLDFSEKLQTIVGDSLRVAFIVGNHDMARGVTFEELSQPLSPLYLHNQLIDVAGTDLRIVGQNGWYDYSFGDLAKYSVNEIAQWKRAYWFDRQIEQPMSDQERMDIVLTESKQQLVNAAHDGKRVMFVTHFVPQQDYLFKGSDDRNLWMLNAMMGSQRLGALLEMGPVDYTIFGHLHRQFAPQTFGGRNEYYNQTVGLKTHRKDEWTQSTFFATWQDRVRIFEIK